jgi:hypothetical protein
MVILSAGAAFRPVHGMFSSGRQQKDLQKEWAAFCKLSGGTLYNTFIKSDAYDIDEKSKGHQYKTGQAIFFSKENIVAIPKWVFWNNDSKPADMYVIFLEEKDGKLEKAITYNRFEMEAIYKTYEHLNELSFIKNNTPEKITVKTLIGRRKLKQEIGYFREKEILFTNNFIYNI